MKDRNKPKQKKRYEPPQLNKVKIRFDEVVLAACKTTGGLDMPAASCVMNCRIDGS